MKAIVKKIKIGTEKTDGGHGDTFEDLMAEKIGKTITVYPRKNSKNWFVDSGSYEFNWHKSWLKFIK